MVYHRMLLSVILIECLFNIGQLQRIDTMKKQLSQNRVHSKRHDGIAGFVLESITPTCGTFFKKEKRGPLSTAHAL